MKIYVRRRHIRQGTPGKAFSCPIALAVAEIVGKVPDVENEVIYIGDGSFYVLPRSARRFIARFDFGKPVKPFAFTIRA